jgi:pSer/pThr/pTyr-binding forkhead associated (FHA) protein
MWLLRTDEQAETPFAFRILPGSIKTIGRSAGAEFTVEAAMVSRLHCQLTAGSTELEVRDLDSTNGTFVNGQRVTQASLKEGDRLGVGRVELVVTRGEPGHPKL